MNYFIKFIEINRGLCLKIENILPQAKPDLTELYSKIVTTYINNKKRSVIVDIGGGRYTPFVKYVSPSVNYKLIVIDDDKHELQQNIDANEILISDVNKNIPLKSDSADLIVSRYVIEHLDNLPTFLQNSNKILKKGGISIHLFSCKFAPFSLLNQILPDNISKLLLNIFIPDSKVLRGFKTSYKYCYYDSIKNNFIQAGYSINKITLSYYQSRYFNFFLPFYLISVLYELIIFYLGLRNLCAYILIIAKKHGD